MRKKTIFILALSAFCVGTLLFSCDSVQAGKYIYYNEKGEQVDYLPQKAVKKSPEKKRVKVRNRSNSSDNTRSAGIPPDHGQKKIKSDIKK